MTFTVVACDRTTGDLGVVVSTARPAVGSRVPWVRTGVAAVATQSITNAALGPMLLERLPGETPANALAAVVATDPERAERQLVVVDDRGRTAGFTGKACKDWAGQLLGDHVAACGNLLVGEAVLTEAVAAFAVATGELRHRLLAAYAAGQAVGGDRMGVQSAAIVVARIHCFPFLDLRVDDSPDPLAELDRLMRMVAREVVPYLPPLTLLCPQRVAVDERISVRVEAAGSPVGGVLLRVAGREVARTNEAGWADVVFTEACPGEVKLVAAEERTSTAAPASYRFKPVVRWVRVDK